MNEQTMLSGANPQRFIRVLERGSLFLAPDLGNRPGEQRPLAQMILVLGREARVTFVALVQREDRPVAEKLRDGVGVALEGHLGLASAAEAATAGCLVPAGIVGEQDPPRRDEWVVGDDLVLRGVVLCRNDVVFSRAISTLTSVGPPRPDRPGTNDLPILPDALTPAKVRGR